MKVKKVTSLLLIGALSVSLAAGCGPKTPAAPAASETGQDEDDSKETSKEEDSNDSDETKETEQGDTSTSPEKDNAASEEENSDADAPVLSDTVLWINTTYAILTAANSGDIHYVGGFERSSANKFGIKGALQQSWEVTDRASADENLAWLLDEGHRSIFREEMKQMQENGYFDLSPEEMAAEFAANDFDAAQTACYLYMMDAYRTYGEQAVDAWDYCRALQLLGWYYVADYYTDQEALDKSLEIAAQLQGMYGSWDEMCESYLLGYLYWTEEDPNDSESSYIQRKSLYDGLKSGEDNPYLLDWNTPLTKTW